MDQPRGLMQFITEIGEQAVARGFQMAAGLSSGLDGLDPTELPTRVVGVADEVMGQGKANTDLIVSLVRSEVDRAVARMGFVREEELAALRRHVERLEAAMASAGLTVSPAAATSSSQPTSKPTKKPVKRPAASADASAPAATAKPTKKPTKRPVTKKPVTKKPVTKAATASEPIDAEGLA